MSEPDDVETPAALATRATPHSRRRARRRASARRSRSSVATAHPQSSPGRRDAAVRSQRGGGHRHPGHRRGVGRQRQGRAGGGRPGWATSPSWSRPGPPCRSWKTRFDQAGIAYRAETSSLVYASRAVRDLLMVLRAVDDPTNHLHIVSALRTPLLGCGDDDLFRFKWERKGRWSYLADQPDTRPAGRSGAGRLGLPAFPLRRADVGGPVGAARDASPATVGRWSSASPRAGRATCGGRIRFVTDQARAWSEATGGNLRQYLHWVGRADGRRCPRGRVDPARERRRRRPDPDHPRRQGPGVPDHDRLGHVDRAAGQAGAGRGGVSRSPEGSGTSSGARSARTSTSSGRRSTSRWACTSASACSTWPAPGPATT